MPPTVTKSNSYIFSNLICIISRQIHIANFKSIFEKMTGKSRENLILGMGNNSCTQNGTDTANLNLICIMSRQIHIPNFKSIYEKMAEKSPETEI